MRPLSIGIAATIVLLLTTLTISAQDKSKDEKLAAIEKDKLALQGGWALVSVEEKGKVRPEDEIKEGRYVFLKDKILEMTGDKLNFEIEYEIEPTSNPKRINEYFKVKTKDGKSDETMIRGIYELDGDTLIICTSGGKQRPTAFDSKDGVLLELKREKKPKAE
jgi:uncharacterized protein (TIGR03067 family)